MATYSKSSTSFSGNNDNVWWDQTGKRTTNRSVVYGPTNSDDGSTNPNWRIDVSKGRDATTARTATKYSLSNARNAQITVKLLSDPTNVWTQYSSWFSGLNTCLFGGFSVTALDNLAIKRFQSKCPDSFKSLTFLGELRETANMLKKGALKLYSGSLSFAKQWKGLRPKYRRNNRLFRKDIADAWLTYSFGIRPLLIDIGEAVKQYNEAPKDARTVVTSQARDYYLVSQKSNLGGLNFVSGRVTRYGIVSVRVSYKAAVVDRYSGQPASADWGFAWPEFVATGWELLPYSFLIDYFGNIGDWLESNVLGQRIGVAWGSKSIKKVALTRNISELYTSDTYTVVSNSLGHSLVRGDLVTRSAVTSLPVPSLSFNAKLSTSRGLNILALIEMRRQDNRYQP